MLSAKQKHFTVGFVLPLAIFSFQGVDLRSVLLTKFEGQQSFLKIVAIFTDCFGGQKIPHENCWPWKEELCTMHNAHQDDKVAITRSLFCLTWGKL